MTALYTINRPDSQNTSPASLARRNAVEACFARATFSLSAAALSGLPSDTGTEVAFAGRSNSGKSSTLNLICRQKSLARTSKTPGRTQLINFFTLSEHARLVDLPGYGYAKVPEAMRQRWGALMQGYLQKRQSLQGLMLVMDIRHPLTDYDAQMLAFCQARALPVHILLNKADKLRRGPAKATLQQVSKALKAQGMAASVQTFSASQPEAGTLDQAYAVLHRWLFAEQAHNTVTE